MNSCACCCHDLKGLGRRVIYGYGNVFFFFGLSGNFVSERVAGGLLSDLRRGGVGDIRFHSTSNATHSYLTLLADIIALYSLVALLL